MFRDIRNAGKYSINEIHVHNLNLLNLQPVNSNKLCKKESHINYSKLRKINLIPEAKLMPTLSDYEERFCLYYQFDCS